jgi:hypothetical protein
MNEDESVRHMKESGEIYTALVDACLDKEIGDAIHAIAYALAEIVTDNDIPKKEFVAEFIERFDSAYTFLINNPHPRSEDKNG